MKNIQAAITGVLLLTLIQAAINAQTLDVAYVPTPHSIVEKMLDVARVGPGDYVIDLGSGDGRIVIAAAQRGAFGHGVDIDPQRIREAKANALEAGVGDKVIFLEENIYETDFSRASVVTMYLFPSINLKLRSAILNKLEPGSRVVSHDFGMDYWIPEEYIIDDGHEIYFWIIPANIHGDWQWKVGGTPFKMNVDQEFQKVETRLLSKDNPLKTDKNTLSGKRISFMAHDPSNHTKYVYSGMAEGDTITGTVQIHKKNESVVKKWNAIRQESPR